MRAKLASHLMRTSKDKELKRLAARELALRLDAQCSRRQVKARCSNAAAAYWARMTPAQKTNELRRRRNLGLLRRVQRALAADKAKAAK